MRPLIGIPPCLDDRGRWRSGRDYHYLDAAYAVALSRAGASAVIVPPQSDVAEVVRRLDGLLLPGGDDFPPDHAYPEHVNFEPVPPAQLAFDRGLLAAALEAGLPVLGICYGMQLLGLEAGATLHYDLPTDCAAADDHATGDPNARHSLSVGPGTRLAEILGADPVLVNSRHHQALATVGPGTLVSARAPDGIIEAIELERSSFAVGVQWHPESMEPAHVGRLFGALVGACSRLR